MKKNEFLGKPQGCYDYVQFLNQFGFYTNVSNDNDFLDGGIANYVQKQDFIDLTLSLLTNSEDISAFKDKYLTSIEKDFVLNDFSALKTDLEACIAQISPKILDNFRHKDINETNYYKKQFCDKAFKYLLFLFLNVKVDSKSIVEDDYSAFDNELYITTDTHKYCVIVKFVDNVIIEYPTIKDTKKLLKERLDELYDYVKKGKDLWIGRSIKVLLITKDMADDGKVHYSVFIQDPKEALAKLDALGKSDKCKD